MTLQQLHYAITISETGSLNKAAEILYVSQPSLTGSMQELEKRYNERFTSRIIGFYDRLIFRGKDIRMKKKLNPQNKQN